MTAAALLEIEKEFSALLTNKKNWRKLLPADSCRKEKSDLILRDSIQGGIYEAILWCNPGFGILSQKQCPKYCMHIRKNPHSKFAICLEPDYIKRKIKRKDPQVQQD